MFELISRAWYTVVTFARSRYTISEYGSLWSSRAGTLPINLLSVLGCIHREGHVHLSSILILVILDLTECTIMFTGLTLVKYLNTVIYWWKKNVGFLTIIQ
ncbi:hypothetical protein M0802_012147 [Mischocyttarus mexicanus]|nr:hypothetical protein M0802_012147 [Mischocyttarus mexicanus]